MTNASHPIHNFAKAIRLVRRSKGLSQEDFGVMSSRTYVSTLERGLKSPTLSKIDTLAQVMEVHPLTLLVLSYVEVHDPEALGRMLELIASEISAIE
ncbi:helix-turn-helix domain-containing protein [Rhodoferax sp. U2-2l]|uniref:helix-turn-helix domain-containing protein n=1 Tax=Rhodoferax sp. U2-2l TaxID=2884000 RepID=UPI001D09B24E|nr:helix-turn-helix transcriptional regulator [Rhodoferax sp. U2-2l]MCB8747000.1 helix-turn-helix domain-containing protein [Rhodoferax sp. U2-2l]